MNQSREIKAFIFGQYFSDGLRITFGVLLPSLLLAQLGQLSIGVSISLGALCVSLTDNPGPVNHKKNGMLLCNLFIFLTAVLTGLINKNSYLVGLEIILLCFLYSMFTVYGNRASAIGTAALLVMILTIDQNQTLTKTLANALYILSGGVWYMLLSSLVSQIKPYRLAQQALGECIKEVSIYVRLKALFYDTQSNYDDHYKKLVSQQIIVHQQQNTIRELLFKSKLITKESTKMGRVLVLIFVDMIDLFEQTMATYYDYHTLKSRYEKAEVLGEFQKIITKLADELENLSYYIIRNEKPVRLYDFGSDLEILKNTIDRVEKHFGLNNLVLKKILINIRNMSNRIKKMYRYFDQEQLANTSIQRDLSKFVSHQDFDLKSLKDNFSFDSSIFRHSLRMSIVCLVGYLVSKLFPLGHHSYWILLTILVILKPDFSLTKERNYQRLMGTIIGGVAGALLLMYVKDQTTLFIVLLLCMIGTYSFQRLNYIVSVLFLTPYILIVFNFLGANDPNIAGERIIDTILGSAIALIASHLILPHWEHYHLKDLLKEALVANYNYLLKVANNLNGKRWDTLSYRLTRKDMYVSSANLGGAFQRMLSEPKSKQHHIKELHEFVVLNHMLSSYISTLIHSTHSVSSTVIRTHHIKSIRKSLYGLSEMIQRFPLPHVVRFEDTIYISTQVKKDTLLEEDYDSKILYEQLELVNQVVKDLSKINDYLLN